MSTLRQKWKTFTLLSIIIPVSLLVSLRLAGILSEPEGPITIAETTTLQTVKWKSERPYSHLNIRENARGLYKKEIKLSQEILIDDYHTESWGYDGSDYVVLTINATATLQTGFVNSANITFREDSENSEIRFFEVQAWPKFYSHAENLSIIDYAHHLPGSGLKAFMELTGVNRPKSVHFDGIVHWVLSSSKNETHSMEIATELVYYNGTVYKKIVQPFQLQIAPDDNDGFETAQEIREGYYPRLYIGPADVGDIRDYYKIYVAEGQRIKVDVNGTAWSWPILPNPSPNFNLYLYDPERNLVFASERENYFQSIDFVANTTGFWFIEVRVVGDYGFYSLTVSLEENQ